MITGSSGHRLKKEAQMNAGVKTGTDVKLTNQEHLPFLEACTKRSQSSICFPTISFTRPFLRRSHGTTRISGVSTTRPVDEQWLRPVSSIRSLRVLRSLSLSKLVEKRPHQGNNIRLQKLMVTAMPSRMELSRLSMLVGQGC